MNTEGIKYVHTNADASKGGIGTTNDSSAGGLNSTAIGVNAIVEAGADGTVALGLNTHALPTATSSVVLGNGSIVAGASSVPLVMARLLLVHHQLPLVMVLKHWVINRSASVLVTL